MNISRRRIIRTTGYTFIGVALFMVPSLLYALFTDDLVCVRAFAIPVSIMLLLGLIMRFAVKPPNGHIWIRDGYLNAKHVWFKFRNASGLSSNTKAIVWYDGSPYV